MNPKYRRILLKLSGETFGGSKGFGFDYDTIRRIAENIISVIELKVEVGVVVGGGNIRLIGGDHLQWGSIATPHSTGATSRSVDLGRKRRAGVER